MNPVVKTRLIKIGNSQGIRIPKLLLEQLHLSDEVELDDHFVWSADFTLIIGITPTGRATVEALQLNREGLVNLRRVLHETGEHPPLETTN